MLPDRPSFSIAGFLQQVSKVPLSAADSEALAPVIAQMPTLTSSYRPWRKFKHMATDLGLNPEAAWGFVKFSQFGLLRVFTDLAQADGTEFHLMNVPHVQESLYRIDRGVGGGGPASLDTSRGVLGSPEVLKRLRIKTWMDEAAESSLIEGASGTRKQATDLLRSGRAPATKGERMIVNNYVAMQRIKTWLDRPLSVEMLLELQAMLTNGTLEDPEEAGRLRLPDENVRVVDERDGSTTYVPPDAGGLAKRLRTLCAFANKEHKDAEFLHPIVKASILHFMIGYEHPFCDGNGRTARAVFYWYALRHGYTIFEFMPISERIRAGHARYPQAYLDTEQEQGDLTHFVLYKLDIVEQSLDRLIQHLKQEELRVRRAEDLLSASKRLNQRQRVLLDHALRHPIMVYTVKSHMNSNGISDVTARSDLEGLVRARCLVKTRDKEVRYHPAPGLAKRLQTKR
jgi:Fic family protein